MWALVLKLLPVILGWFGIGTKDERDVSHDQGVAQGKAETERDAAVGELHDIAKADAARAAAPIDPDSVLNDPDNAGPDVRH